MNYTEQNNNAAVMRSDFTSTLTISLLHIVSAGFNQ